MQTIRGLAFSVVHLLIGGAIALVVLAAFFTRANRVLLFWIAFVLTRPLGATLGDLLTKPIDRGGLDFGTVGSSLVLGTVLAGLIVHASVAATRASR